MITTIEQQGEPKQLAQTDEPIISSDVTQQHHDLVQDGSVAVASISKDVLKWFVWAVPIGVYIMGYPQTMRMLDCLHHMSVDIVEDHECHPYLPAWRKLSELGGVFTVINHILWGSPSVALYLMATLCFFPLKPILGKTLSQKAGACFIISGGLCLAVCLLAAFQLIGALLSKGLQGIVVVAVSLVLVLTTLPFLQLIGWQIEYSLRALLDRPRETILPVCLLKFISKTSAIKFVTKPFHAFFKLAIFPEGYSISGVAVVQSLHDADYYSTKDNAKDLSTDNLRAINEGLLTNVMYGTLAVIPMWALLTDFGMVRVEISGSSRCIWSKMLSSWNPAQLGIIGLLGPYWVFSFGWMLWGVWIFWLWQ